MQNKLPQFEANQLLSSDHLNQVILYLEEQSRLTRNHLLGSGIVSGLDLKRSNTEITISEGVGVTSAGYLLLLQSQFMQPGANGKGTVSYNKKRVFQPKSLLFPYLGDMQNTAGSYELFNGITDIWQLIETGVADNTDPGNVSMLTADDLNNRVVVLFLQIGVKELKSCEADSCMELGRQWTYSAVPLLMHKTNADKLLQAEKGYNPAPPPNTDMAPLTNPAYYLPDIYVQRVDLAKITDTVSVQQLSTVYTDAIYAVWEELSKPTYQSIDDNLRQVLKDNFSTAPFAEFLKKLHSVWRSPAIVRRQEYCQYAYGFVQDFAQAYKELQAAVYEYTSYEIPSLTSFPHHLRLGLVPANGGVLTSDMFPPQAYRHGFTSSRILEQQNNAYQDAVLLYKRLISLADHLTIITQLNDVRITPGNDSSRPIATRAIPFYYAFEKADDWKNFLTYWSPQLYRQNKTGRVLSYYDNYHSPDRTKAAKESTDIALHQPLLLQHPDKNFYRIEGHIGASYIEVFQIIQTYISQYNLCFDLQMVRLNKATLMLIKDKHILFNDLESLHNVIREEIKCLLTTELNYFRNIRLTKIVNKQPATRQTAAVAADAQAAPQAGAARIMEDTKFYRTSAAITKRSVFTKTTGLYKFIDFGVTESVANLTTKFQGQLTVADINTMLVANNVGILQTKTTPAASYVTRIIAALENLDKTLSIDFDDFNIDAYEQALTNLETETRNFVLFAKNLSDIVLKSDSNIVKGEVLDYLDRLLYECDFEKISAIEDERTRREQQVGVNSYLDQYIQNNPGLEHTAGVIKGGTFILVFNEDGTVVADFSLPYRSGGGSNITQYVLGILKTILLAGQVLDVNNAPVLKANVTLNGETLPLDETGRFQKAIIPNSPLLLRVEAEGFEPIQQYTRAEEDDIFKVLTLFTKAQEPKIIFTLTVTGPENKPQPAAEVKLGETVLPLDANGIFKGEIKAKMSPTLLTITQPGFKTYTDSAFITEAADKSLIVRLSKLISVIGALVGPDQQPVNNATITFNGSTIKTTDGKFSFKDLDGEGSYNLVIEAENMEKFTETIKPNNVDVNRTFQLALPITFTVKVGIYVASKPQFETPPIRNTPIFTRPILATRLGSIRTVAAATRFKAGTVFNPRDRRFSEESINEIAPIATVDAAGGRGGITISGKTFSLVDNNDASSQVDGVPQTYNSDLKLFSSNERKALHKLTVKVKSLSLSFAGDLGISNNDVLVLIPARQGYAFQGVYSIVPNPDEGNLKACNAFLATQLSLPNVTIMGRSFEVRFYTQQDATEFASLMTAANIKYTTLSDR